MIRAVVGEADTIFGCTSSPSCEHDQVRGYRGPPVGRPARLSARSDKLRWSRQPHDAAHKLTLSYSPRSHGRQVDCLGQCTVVGTKRLPHLGTPVERFYCRRRIFLLCRTSPWTRLLPKAKPSQHGQRYDHKCNGGAAMGLIKPAKGAGIPPSGQSDDPRRRTFCCTWLQRSGGRSPQAGEDATGASRDFSAPSGRDL